MMKFISTIFLLLPILFVSCNENDNKGNALKLEKTYYPSGKLLSVKEYSNNGTDWRTIKFFENGDTSSIAHYHNWKYTGEATIFFPNGQKNFQQNYDTSGQSDGMYYLWNMDGQLKETGLFVHGHKNGVFKTFHDNGIEKSIEQYDMGKKQGEWIFFNEKGDTVRKEFYRGDSLVK